METVGWVRVGEGRMEVAVTAGRSSWPMLWGEGLWRSQLQN
jgi:hypothetical protein